MKNLLERFGVRLLCILVGAACVFPVAGWSADGIEMRFLSSNKKVIPVFCSIGNWQITDVKLPELVVTNNREDPLTVEQAEVVGFVSGEERIRMRIPREDLLEAIGKTAAWIDKPDVPLPAVQLMFGDVAIPEGPLSTDGTVAAGRSVLLPLSKAAYLHYVGQAKLDGMEIRLIVSTEPNRQETLSFPVLLIPYEAKGSYQFPLRGDLRIAYNPLSYIHHRASGSQEFGMDIVAANQAGAPSFTDISLPEPKKLSDYAIWGREVFAIGDGVVADTGDKFPEGRMSDPDLFGRPGYTGDLLKELIPEIGWTNAVAGNYVVIDHGNGEFSVYAHLQEGSIRVKQGEPVETGQIIAKVGNTGNSGAPHLHFQLMDSGNFFTANGLPVMFENVPAEAIISEFPVAANCLVFSDSIFTTAP
jgi:hypothetical protein